MAEPYTGQVTVLNYCRRDAALTQMRRVIVIVGCVLSTGALWADTKNPASPASTLKEKHRGVCFVAGPGRPADAAFDRLAALNVNWISQTPFGWQQSAGSPEVVLATSGRIWWGESDEGLADAARRARNLGIRTILKPHVWIRDRSDGRWRGNIDFSTPEEWDRWWASYRHLILHYAELAESAGMEALCIGTELRSAVLNRPDAWRRLIADVRAVYGGELTYSANWYREFEEVPFWDALDYIGLQVYFPLADSAAAALTLDDLKAAWAPHVKLIEAMQQRVGKPVLFTEVGYRSTADAAVEPWIWRSAAPVDLELQAACYEAMFRTFWRKPWFAGTHVWKWFPEGSTQFGGRRARRHALQRERGFTPQGKPAEEVLARWYRAGAE
ncbi:MAG: glycoside hydrolase TIM-barrel-like domain-containing protein [Gemmatimonadota bacterium]|nr:glycoside hydrolase TIM-barrel-like domain-containing protein [Gemmatimonadota bacterium]